MKTNHAFLGSLTLLAALTSAQAADAPAVNVQNLFVNIADRTMPSVVNIFTTKNTHLRRSRAPEDFFDLWNRPYDDERAVVPPAARPKISQPLSLGTGFVIEASEREGLILTNNHVVQGADEVKVKFTESDDERELSAEVIGTDPELDIALLRIKVPAGGKLQAVVLGDSDRLRVGEWIAAIGNPFGHGHSVSHGIVSAKARTLPGGFGKYLQVDAPINPGNSGGPLVDLNAEVVGINNAIDARGPGIGFAIPINAVKALLPQLKANGHIERGYIGIGIEPRPADGAPLVSQIFPNAPAARAGLRPGDVIMKVNDEATKTTSDVIAAITKAKVNTLAKTAIQRAGKTLHFDVRVARRPDLKQAQN